jgi:error-prone DNA polymerase
VWISPDKYTFHSFIIQLPFLIDSFELIFKLSLLEGNCRYCYFIQYIDFFKPVFKPAVISPYAELHCVSNFSFLRGASHPDELVQRAASLGYGALAITDECSLAGVVRAHLQARTINFPILIGAEFSLQDLWPSPLQLQSQQSQPARQANKQPIRCLQRPEHNPRLVVLATNRNGYGNLSEFITTARMRAPKGQYQLKPEDFDHLSDCLALLVPPAGLAVRSDLARQCISQLNFFKERFERRLWLAAELLTHGDDTALLEHLRAMGKRADVPLVASGDVHYHVRSRKSLHDTLTAIDLNTPLRDCGFALAPNAEQHLRSRLRLAQRYPMPLLEETLEIAAQCHFSLNELRYEYPKEIVPPNQTPSSWLRELTYAGVPSRYPNGVPETVKQQIEHELSLIAELQYEAYFLTVADIVRFARERGILCQGRGSAANSAVCYCLGVTEVDPSRMSVLFERFISKERNEPPDIDVDFEHQRREEVMQYIYNKYGRDRAALTATVVSYRPRSALRDVGKALGVDQQRLDQMSRSHQWWDGKHMKVEKLADAGFDPDSAVVQHWVSMVNTLMGFPRHLSQHTGGFVIARDKLTRLVPIENAAMVDRSVIEWDKDDLDALGLLKVDVLALGMLSAIRRALDLLTQRRAPANLAPGEKPPPFLLQHIPAEDAATYDMICRADTVGVFQIESRAQMSMLPRLRPRCFYDLVIEVAIVRPGPIQGGMVHPFLKRRQGIEPVEYPREEIKPALARTLGVPIFQEQVMQVAILAAGFTPGEADQLRRAMAAWKRKGGLGPFQERVIDGMLARGYDLPFAERIFKQIEGFGEYGFPESHAASFALLVYVSCWIKQHEPAAFLAAMLNSQPLGFYAPAQLARDAREHGVRVRAADVLISNYECSLEEEPGFEYIPSKDQTDHRPQPAVRLGLNRIRSLSEDGAHQLLQARAKRCEERGITIPRCGEPLTEFAFDSVEDLARTAQLNSRDLQALASANALQNLAGHRANAHWEVAGVESMPALLADTVFDEAPTVLKAPPETESIVADYRSLGLSMGRHPMSLVRPHLNQYRVEPAQVLHEYPSGRLARASGLVTHRQRPATAKGVLFVTLEDETGQVNIIIWPKVIEQYRRAVLSSQLLTVYGVWQRDDDTGQVQHLIARRIEDHTHLLGTLTTRSRDFR